MMQHDRTHYREETKLSIRRRTWATRTGTRTAWIVDYGVFDAKQGKRIRAIKTFKRERDARTFAAQTHVQIREGMHVPASASMTVAKAGELWLVSGRSEGLEPGTIEQYDQHLRLHIVPYIGHLKLPQVTVPTVAEFQQTLRDNGRSAPMVRGVVGSLHSIFAVA